MSKQQLKLLATVTPEKIRPEKPFVQIEGKLTEAQVRERSLQALALLLVTNPQLKLLELKEVLMSKQKPEKFTVTPDKTCPEKPLVQLTEDQLEAIAGGQLILN